MVQVIQEVRCEGGVKASTRNIPKEEDLVKGYVRVMSNHVKSQ